jgi:hypothetical protein
MILGKVRPRDSSYVRLGLATGFDLKLFEKAGMEEVFRIF